MKRMLVPVLVVAVASLLSGCAGTTSPIVTLATVPTTAPATTAPPVTDPATTTVSETTTSVTISFDNASVFTAELSGGEIVPAVETHATGTAVIKIDPTSSRAYFKLTLSNVDRVLASRVHEGLPGSNGQGLLILYPGPTLDGPYTGVLAQGYFDSSALIGSLTGASLAEFAVLLQAGKAYVNVGTVLNPAGEIRGQIMEGSDQ